MMMEQVDVPAGAMAASATLGRALSDEARASLQAVRVAQEAARLRVRRQTVRARIWAATMMVAVGVTAAVFGVRMVGRRHARPQAPTSARPAPISPERVTQAIAPPAPETVVAAASRPGDAQARIRGSVRDGAPAGRRPGEDGRRPGHRRTV